MKKIFFMICLTGALSMPAGASFSDNTSEESLSALRKKQELLSQLRQGQAVISKAIIVQDGEAICSLDLQNREELIPPFAKTVPENFRSSVSINKNIPECGERIISHLPHRDDLYIVEGDQTAAVPLVLGLGSLAGGVLGCLISRFQEESQENTFITGFLGVGIGLTGIGTHQGLQRVAPRAPFNLSTGIFMPIISAIGGYLICEKTLGSSAVYPIEKAE